ncbi:hypothetical protein PMAC_000515 [Pneumocystis sp. 'macacae']|nr:hypothetical protein PMAC_000515 [Pneumocystis sp. 'macacae']
MHKSGNRTSMSLCTQTTACLEKTAHTLRSNTHLSTFKTHKPSSDAHTQTPTCASSLEIHRPHSSVHTVDALQDSQMHPQSLSTHVHRKNICSLHNEAHVAQEVMHTLSTSTHILGSSADYLEHQLNQLARARQDEEHGVSTAKIPASTVSTQSLLTMLLASPQRTGFSESAGVDLLSDHGSTSGHSTPTPPLQLHFTSRPTVKFAAPPLARANAHELTHELLPILQPPCFQQALQQGLHTDSSTERPQHHVRFQAGAAGTDDAPAAKILGGGAETGFFLDRLNHSTDTPAKPATKILLDHVLPKEKMSLIVQDEDEFDDPDTQEDSDDPGDGIDMPRPPQHPRGMRMPLSTQKGTRVGIVPKHRCSLIWLAAQTLCTVDPVDRQRRRRHRILSRAPVHKGQPPRRHGSCSWQPRRRPARPGSIASA